MSVRKENRYNLNRILLSSFGQWPMQPPLQRFFLSANLIIICGSQVFFQTCGLIAAWTNWDVVIDCASPILIDIVCLLKFFNCLFNIGKMRDLIERMQSAWNLILTDKQIEILKLYTHEGYLATRTYTVVMYLVTLFYTTLPHVPNLILYFSHSNETIKGALLFHYEEVLNVEKYYYLILLHSCCGAFLFLTLSIAADSMFLVYVQHACGMFALIGHQLENVQDGNNLDVNVHLASSEDEAYKSITDSIIKHKDTLEFSELLASAYSTSFLFQTGFTILLMTFSGVQAVIYMDKTAYFVRFAMTGITVSFHFLFLSLPSQKLIDHSLQLNDSIYYSDWYAVSIRSRRLLDIMLMRSRVPCQITAGKMYVMSLENFSSVMQAAMSYFTMLTSVR